MKDELNYFDYKNPEKYLKKIYEFQNPLIENGFNVFLYGGTLLGSIRYKDLIPHDDDIDLFYISKKTHRKAVLDEFEEVIRPILEKNGWEIQPISWTLNGPKLMMGQFHIIKDNISLDIWTAWFDKNDKFNVTMTVEDTHIMKSDILPIRQGYIKEYSFNVPNNSEMFLEHLYGKNWQIPDATYKIPCNKNFLQKSILKVIDQFGWAYYFIAKEQQKYSYHNISYKRIQDMPDYTIDEDIIYFHSPGMGEAEINNIIDTQVDRKRTKIIGAYGGENPWRYNHADLILTISFPFLKNLRQKYPNKPCIFLPEAIDTEFFHTNRRNRKQFNVGYVGRPCKVKRMHLLEKLDFNISTHTEWGTKYFVDGRTLDTVKDFYKSIDCLILTSQSECMPRVVLEAMSMGLPVISTDVGCMRMLIDSEWIVPNSSEEDIVKNINDRLNILKKYPSIRREVGKRNRNHIKEYFNWEQVQQKWDAVCNALVLNQYDTILKIGQEFEDKWSTLYDNYQVANRNDLPSHTIPIKSMQVKNHIIENYIGRRLRNVVLLHTSCLQVIKYGKLFGNNHYIGVTINEICNVKQQLTSDGWLEQSNHLFLKDKLSLKIDIFSGNTKIHGCGMYKMNVPFPVVSYLNNTIGEGWKKNEQ